MLIARMHHATGRSQTLDDHLQFVGNQAKIYAQSFDSTDFTEIAARLHDIGKATDDFQAYIRNPYGKRGTVQHALPGASLVWQKRLGQSKQYLLSLLLANVIAGHHRGLYDQTVSFFRSLQDVDDSLSSRIGTRVEEVVASLDDSLSEDDRALLDRWKTDYLAHWMKGKVEKVNVPLHEQVSLETFTRMALSALVDADWSDASRFQNETEEMEVSSRPSFEVFQTRFQAHRASLEQSTERSKELTRLQMICEEKGRGNERSVELVLPTGYGKTFASLSYALEHAKKYQKNRIITALPLQNLTAEMSALYRTMFGEQHVIEDYSLVDHRGMSEDERERLAIERETWDRPFVVTTTVQLFESLFSNRPRALRKLHRIAGSVIILDEYHLLPMHLLEPILRQLDVLQDQYDVTVVFVSATNLPLTTSQTIHQWQLKRLPKPLLPTVEETSRVQFHSIHSVDDQALAERVDHRATLCIVNTRKQSQRLFLKMKEKHPDRELYYLSTTLIGRARKDRLHDIQTSVRRGKRPIVVSTQVLEAGVDISFEVVYREMAPLPSIIQAAGRCNRYGEQEMGDVYVVEYENASRMPASYEAGIAQVKSLIDRYGMEAFTSLEARASYYRRIVSNEANRHGLPNIPFLFETVAETFRMIDDSSVEVICMNAPGVEATLLHQPKTKEWWRAMQGVTVPLPATMPGVREVDGIYVWDGPYDEQIGVPLLKGGEAM